MEKLTVLVVDDDPEIVGAIAITLEREGYRVLRAYDGMEALDLALDQTVSPAEEESAEPMEELAQNLEVH